MIRNLMKYEQAVDFESKMAYYKHDIPAGTTYPLHWHDFIELEIILSGKAKGNAGACPQLNPKCRRNRYSCPSLFL